MKKIAWFLLSIVVACFSLRPYANMVAARIEHDFASVGPEVDLAPGLGVAVIFYMLFYFLFHLIFFGIIGAFTFSSPYRRANVEWNANLLKRINLRIDLLKIALLAATLLYMYHLAVNPFYSPIGKGIAFLDVLSCLFWMLQVIQERTVHADTGGGRK